MTAPKYIFGFLITGLYLTGTVAARAEVPPLITDLSSHRISITSSFTGTELLLFGAIEQKGDLIVVVRGPEEPVVVRRKERKAGIWVNSESVVIDGAPGFYAVAASRAIQQMASQPFLARLEIGAENLRFRAPGVDETELVPFREALIRQRLRQGLYHEEVGNVRFLGDRLFHTRLHFPANVPVGTYVTQVYLIQGDEVIGAQTTPLVISKTGVERLVFDFANQQPALYGLTAVLVALFAGWLAATIFRKS